MAHNTAKLEVHGEGKERRRLLVHRKGAPRALPPGHPELPSEYRESGQPVIIGGSMETGSYLLAGSRRARRRSSAPRTGAGA